MHSRDLDATLEGEDLEDTLNQAGPFGLDPINFYTLFSQISGFRTLHFPLTSLW